MNRLVLFFIVIISAIVIAFVLLFMLSHSTEEGREGARPREGITTVHSTNINVKMEYYVVSTRDPNLIGVRISLNPTVNTIKPTIVGIYFPYPVKLNQTYNAEYADYTNWYESENEYEHGTAFVWDIPCQSSYNCNLYTSQDVEFILDPSIRFDSKDAYRHGIKIRFDNTNGLASDFFNKFEEPKNLVYGVENTKIQATIIIPENAQQIHTIPLPQPNMFHNIGTDYSNTQLDWNVTKDSRTFFVDFENSNERIDFEEKQSQFAAFGVFAGLVVGGLSIVVAIFYGRSDSKTNFSSTYHTQISSLKNDIDVKTTLSEQVKTHLIERKYLAIIFIVITIIVFVSVSLNSYIHEISNNVTLVVEVGVGFIMAVVIYAISRRSEAEIENKVNGVFDIVKEREEFRKDQEHYVSGLLLNVFENMKTDVQQVLFDAEVYPKLEDPSQKKLRKDQIISGCAHIRILAETNLDDPTNLSPEFFDFNMIGTLKTLSSICKNEPSFSDDGKTVNVSFCNNIKNMIEPWINEFNEKLGMKEKTTLPKAPQLESDITALSISTSSDRTVYPLGSIVHMQANLPYVIQGEQITFEIFNSKRKLIHSQKIDPSTYGDLKSKDSNIFEVSYEMKGNEWKIGEAYIVRATHGSSYSEDSFLIDQRMPAVQSDKSIYMINSDMIITVIDPDADKDSQVVDYVGNRENSKLILESKYGKIDGYKLVETGTSTGIFQGIIGIIGIRNDGSVIERNVDGKIIDKIQGTGIEDGFIGGSPGEEIIITYKNNTGTAYLTVFVANFGATIELDQKVYKPNDKVYITVVAPDLNLDYNSNDEIGQKPESIVKIRTSKDKLSNYKLIETGPDTGIFVGELHLTESEELSSSNKPLADFGPNDGYVVCSKDDFIEVTLTLFGSESVVGRALIKL